MKHTLHRIISQRVYQIAAGYEDGNDCTTLRTDPSIKATCDELPLFGSDLSSQSTISRFENYPRRTMLYRIGLSFIDAFIDSYSRQPKGIILDFDDTDDPTQGHQQMSLFNGYHDNKCYMPLHVYEGQSGKLIAAILRPGKLRQVKRLLGI